MYWKWSWVSVCVFKYVFMHKSEYKKCGIWHVEYIVVYIVEDF